MKPVGSNALQKVPGVPMKLQIIASCVLVAALAACGGGGSSGGGVNPPMPAPSASLQPVQSYSIAITYTGGLEPNGTTVQYRVAAGRTANASPTASPVPVMLVAPDSTAPQAIYGPGVTGALVTANVQPSPSPPVASAPAWSSSTSDIAVATPQPSSSPSLSTIVTVPTIATTGSCTISVSIGAPVNGAQSIPCYVYPRLTLWCPHAAPSTERVPAEVVQGVAFDASGNAVPQSSPATSDVWVDGPDCYGAFQNATETGLTLHFANGGTSLTGGWSTTPFYTVTAAQYANTMQAIAVDPTIAGDIFVFKDALGRAVKFEPSSYQYDSSVSEGQVSGGFQVAGQSIDGF